ncbi:phosphate/phosphite/phosphonate ABC transporter substrate-binding protein [Microlunatus soli]|uniref:Phosphonate transport system substrate-binding protein n=1 Tax=Microlunatus soli TaxID=630515 RepID=A0A1H1ZFM6_9ACTN|nr:phosphate/phosphite/phosphonate ABC transporter substrate-binding protein [Microlunatus soli]SDT32292.1 phosphonate transport system substrate-binding protein [Microlunatus soli]
MSADRFRTRLRTAVAGLVAVVPILAVAVSGCGADATSAADGEESATCPNGQIRFGVEPFEDPAKLTPAFTVLGDALSKKLNCPVKVQIVENYSAEVLAMQNGQLEIGQFGPLGYVFASDRAKAEPLVSFGDGSGKLSTYKAGIWVPKDSPVKTVADLKGRSLALSSTGSTSGDALPRFALKQAGVAESAVKIDYAGGHPQSMLALVNGKVDAAEINTQQQATAAEAGTFDESKFRRIWTSEPIPNDPITVPGDLDPQLKKSIKNALTSLPKSDVAKVGAYLDVEPGPLVPVTKQTYQPLFELAETLGLTEKDAE